MLSYEGYFLFVFYFILPSQLYCRYAIEKYTKAVDGS